MTSIILRRRKLGRGSATGIANFSTTGIYQVRNWVTNDVPAAADAEGFVFRWGCTSDLPTVFADRTVVNSARSIHWCSDKRQGRLDMQAAGVSVPKTFGHYQDCVEVTNKVVLRPDRHAQGRNLWVFDLDHTAQYVALCDKARELGTYYISELINKVAEYRVFVCQNRVVWVARKTPGNPEDVAWNVARGGRFDNVRWDSWPLPVIKAALAAAKVSGTDFCGVDVMVDAEDKPYVLEVNSAPSQTSEYRQKCVAKAFDYIVTNGKDHFPDVSDGTRRTYKSYIHPALRENNEQVPSNS